MKSLIIKKSPRVIVLNEKELIQGCINGIESHCKKLYDNHYGKMFNVCLRFARDREEAQDILQEGYIRVFKNIHQFDFKGSLEGWMRKIMVNTAISYNRKYNLNRITNYVDNNDLLSIGNNDAHFYENNYNNHFGAKHLLLIIQQLPPVYKLVFTLNAIEGYSHHEISNILGISEGTSRSNLSKARSILRQIISPLMEHRKLSCLV